MGSRREPSPRPLHRHFFHRRHIRSFPPVYSRDFAYSDSRPVVLVVDLTRMERESVTSKNAKSFAE